MHGVSITEQWQLLARPRDWTPDQRRGFRHGWGAMGRRTAPLPHNWAQLRRLVLNRDGQRCTWTTNGERCTERATDVDHIIPASQGGTDELDNLRALCRWHHERKTAREANAARVKIAPRRRAGESHPGMI